jgi:hypothetical protein
MKNNLEAIEPRTKASLDVEIEPSNWKTIKQYDTYEQAVAAQENLKASGIEALISCECGAYEYGECEGCLAAE